MGPVRAMQPYEITWKYVHLLGNRDLWFVHDVRLYISIQTQERRDQLSSEQIAEGAVGTLEVTFRPQVRGRPP